MNDILKDRYQLFHSLGSGGLGTTFLATDLHSPSKKKVVVKSFKPVQNQTSFEIIEKLFLKEASVLEDLGSNSTQIPTLYAYFCDEDQYYLVQEYMEGKNLAQLGVISSRQCFSILSSLLETLRYVHSKNIIHGDIKPENIIIRDRDQVPVLIGLISLEEIMNDKSTSTSSNLFSTDIYALSLTMICALTGKKFKELSSGNKIENLEWQSLVPNINNELKQVLEKGSKAQTNNHYRTTEKMFRDLHKNSQNNNNNNKSFNISLRNNLIFMTLTFILFTLNISGELFVAQKMNNAQDELNKLYLYMTKNENGFKNEIRSLKRKIEEQNTANSEIETKLKQKNDLIQEKEDKIEQQKNIIERKNQLIQDREDRIQRQNQEIQVQDDTIEDYWKRIQQLQSQLSEENFL